MHLGTLVFIPLLAAVLYIVLRDSYGAFEILVGISIAVIVLFVISAPAIVIHVSPVGPAGLLLFVVALWLLSRESVPVPVAKEPLVAA